MKLRPIQEDYVNLYCMIRYDMHSVIRPVVMVNIPYVRIVDNSIQNLHPNSQKLIPKCKEIPQKLYDRIFKFLFTLTKIPQKTRRWNATTNDQAYTVRRTYYIANILA